VPIAMSQLVVSRGRAIMGRYLTWLFYFGEAWVRANVAALFPVGDRSDHDGARQRHRPLILFPAKRLSMVRPKGAQSTQR
jgi:hypothetical protein